MQANMMALVAEADAAALAVEAAKSELEIARQAADAAKQVLDSTKGAYDDVLSKADDAGVPKAKLRKLVDERLRALIDAGLVEMAASTKEKPKRGKAVARKESRPEDDAGDDESASDAGQDADAGVGTNAVGTNAVEDGGIPEVVPADLAADLGDSPVAEPEVQTEPAVDDADFVDALDDGAGDEDDEVLTEEEMLDEPVAVAPAEAKAETVPESAADAPTEAGKVEVEVEPAATAAAPARRGAPLPIPSFLSRGNG